MPNRLEDLYTRCRQHHLKRLVRAFGYMSVFLVIVIAGVYSYVQFFMQTEPSVQIAKIEKTSQAAIKPENFTPKVSNDAVAKAVAKMKEQPLVQKEKTHELKPTPLMKKEEKTILVEPKQKVIEQKSFFSDVTRERSLDDWIEKYNQQKSYSIAIYIAKQYYEKNEYKNSGIWAKRANKLDRNKEEAWLIYAKSVYALGDTPKAQRILRVFLRYKNSTKAELLLLEWSKEGE